MCSVMGTNAKGQVSLLGPVGSGWSLCSSNSSSGIQVRTWQVVTQAQAHKNKTHGQK